MKLSKCTIKQKSLVLKKLENFVIKKTNTPKILSAQLTPLLKVISENLPLICFITVVSI